MQQESKLDIAKEFLSFLAAILAVSSTVFIVLASVFVFVGAAWGFSKEVLAAFGGI